MKKYLFLILSLFIFVFTLASCNNKETKDDYAVTVTAPTGAPSFALSTLAVNDKKSYKFIEPDAIGAAFSKNEFDFVVAPINAGAKLYKAKKSTYKLAAVLTWGNLYFASQIENFTLDTINGKELTLFGEGTINASIANYILTSKNITPSNIKYLAGANNTQSTLVDDENAIVMTAEPALTGAKAQKPNIVSISVQDLFKELSGNAEFAQAGIFVKESTAKDHKEVVKDYLAKVKDAADNIINNIDNVAKACVELEFVKAEGVAKKGIPGCNIKFKAAKDAKSLVEATANIDLTQFGGGLPSEDFYFEF